MISSNKIIIKVKKYDMNINIYKTQNDFVAIRNIGVLIAQILIENKKVQNN